MEPGYTNSNPNLLKGSIYWDQLICFSPPSCPALDLGPDLPPELSNNGFNGSHGDTNPVLTAPMDDGVSGYQQECMVSGVAPMQGINGYYQTSSCYNISGGPPLVAEPLTVQPPLCQVAVEGPVSTVALVPHNGNGGQSSVPENGDGGQSSVPPESAYCSGYGSGDSVNLSEVSGGGGDAVKKGAKKTKAIRWSKEEHMLFLIGIKMYKEGDWKSISRHLVTTRSATQVASHAQKYNNKWKSSGSSVTADVDGIKKKRASIHDVTLDDIVVDPVEIKNLQRVVENQHRKRRMDERRAQNEPAPIEWCETSTSNN